MKSDNYFNKAKVGAAYYPEVWDKATIDDDISKMKEVGISVVRIGEFAWGTMESEEGKFDFSFFNYVLDKLYEAKIDVIFCTPTPTPPKWLTDKYSETLIMQDNGIRKQFGARIHPCKSSPKYRERISILVNEMCKALANHKAIIGWQIDNEISPNGGCFCEYCKKGFIEFLREKYKTIENLNDTWVNKRWSMEYSSFEAIIPPRSDTRNHPSLEVEWTRFHSKLNCDFIHFQADIVRKYSSKPIGTDMMPFLDQNYYDMNSKLDVVQFNHYEPQTLLEHPNLWFDFIRPIKDRPFWITETQVNWAGAGHAVNGYRHEGNCYINTWLPVAKGAELNMYWHWREHLSGHELTHGAILNSCGRYCYNISDVRHAINDFNKCGKLILGKIKSDIAIHFSTTSWISYKSIRVCDKLNYLEFIYDRYHKAFRHYNVDVIDTPHDVADYKVVISPFTCCLEEFGIKEKMIEFVKNGGTWIVGPFANIFNDCLTKQKDAPYGFLEDFAGIYTKFQMPIENDVLKAKWADNSELEVKYVFEGVETTTSKSLASFTNEWPKGLSVITEKKVGKGKVIFVGTVISEKDLLKLVPLKEIFSASDNVDIVDKGDCYIIVELDRKEGYVQLDKEYFEVLSEKKVKGKVKIKPFSVLVLKK